MGRKKVLVIDDEMDFLKVVTLRLEANDYEVITALGGKEGLKKIKANKPDVVLLDISMPELDGIQTLKKIRRQDKNLPVFMITAFSNQERFQKAKDLNASGFMVKTADLQKEIKNIDNAIKIADRFRR